MSETNDAALPKVAFAVVALLVMAYSLLITQRLLFGVFIVVGLFGTYLLWRFFLLASRFTRATERIADSLEESESPLEEGDGPLKGSGNR